MYLKSTYVSSEASVGTPATPKTSAVTHCFEGSFQDPREDYNSSQLSKRALLSLSFTLTSAFHNRGAEDREKQEQSPRAVCPSLPCACITEEQEELKSWCPYPLSWPLSLRNRSFSRKKALIHIWDSHIKLCKNRHILRKSIQIVMKPAEDSRNLLAVRRGLLK